MVLQDTFTSMSSMMSYNPRAIFPVLQMRKRKIPQSKWLVQQLIAYKWWNWVWLLYLLVWTSSCSFYLLATPLLKAKKKRKREEKRKGQSASCQVKELEYLLSNRIAPLRF
jgi:hypothetical protein